MKAGVTHEYELCNAKYGGWKGSWEVEIELPRGQGGDLVNPEKRTTLDQHGYGQADLNTATVHLSMVITICIFQNKKQSFQTSRVCVNS